MKAKWNYPKKRFSWLRGAYGLTGPNKKICRPHLYLTVKRGVTKCDVRRELEDKFKCDAKEHFELLKEPKRQPKVKYLGKVLGKRFQSNNESKASVKAVPGCGVLAATACISTVCNPMPLTEENEGDDKLVVGGKGTLTMFCSRTGHHYALTCFHVGCANDETSFNAAFNKIDNVQIIRSSLQHYENYAKTQQYYFIEDAPVQNNNGAIAFGDNGSKKTCLGTFENCHFDNECDILSVKIADGVEVECKVADVTSPDWNEIWDELHERVIKKPDQNPVKVEKTGFSSGLTHGHIITCDFNYYDGANLLYQNAIVIKGCPDPFLEGGDSGSLVFYRDSKDKKQVFAYGVCEVDKLTLPKQHELIRFDDDVSDASSIWSEDEALTSSGEDEIESEDDSKNEAIELSEDKYEHMQEFRDSHTDKKEDYECESISEIEFKDECKDEKKSGQGCVDDAKVEYKNRDESECERKDKLKGKDYDCKVKCERKNNQYFKETDDCKYECEEEPRNESKDDECEQENEVDDQDDIEIIFQAEGETRALNATPTGPYFVCLRLDTALKKVGLEKAACFDHCCRE